MHNQVIALADEFIDLCAQMTERPFGLREFSVFVSTRLGHEATMWEPDLEGAIALRELLSSAASVSTFGREPVLIMEVDGPEENAAIYEIE